MDSEHTFFNKENCDPNVLPKVLEHGGANTQVSMEYPHGQMKVRPLDRAKTWKVVRFNPYEGLRMKLAVTNLNEKTKDSPQKEGEKDRGHVDSTQPPSPGKSSPIRPISSKLRRRYEELFGVSPYEERYNDFPEDFFRVPPPLSPLPATPKKEK